jgi:hypothetical protein
MEATERVCLNYDNWDGFDSLVSKCENLMLCSYIEAQYRLGNYKEIISSVDYAFSLDVDIRKTKKQKKLYHRYRSIAKRKLGDILGATIDLKLLNELNQD